FRHNISPCTDEAYLAATGIVAQPSVLTGKVQFRLYLRYSSTPLKIFQGVRRCVFLPCPAVCRRRVEACAIRRTRLHGLMHRVVDVEDDALRAVCAVRLLVPAFDDGEGLQNVVHVIAPDAVEVEVSRIEFAAQQEATFFVPAEGRARVAAVGGEALQVMGR